MSKMEMATIYKIGRQLHICVKNANRSYILASAPSRLKMGVQSGEFFLYFVEDPAGFIQERFSARWIDEENGVQGLYGLRIDQPETPIPVALLFMRAKGWDKTKVDEWLRSHSTYLPKQLREGRRLKKRIRKKPPGPVKRLLPSPLPKNSAGFAKGWIGDGLYVAANDAVIPKAALDSMRRREVR